MEGNAGAPEIIKKNSVPYRGESSSSSTLLGALAGQVINLTQDKLIGEKSNCVCMGAQ